MAATSYAVPKLKTGGALAAVVTVVVLDVVVAVVALAELSEISVQGGKKSEHAS